MPAELLLHERVILDVAAFVELVIWRVPKPLEGSRHPYKYRLAYIVDRECVVRYDNEAGKGDHCHRQGRQEPYRFTSPERLLADFWREVDQEAES
jgi:hypothetical protein